VRHISCLLPVLPSPIQHRHAASVILETGYGYEVKDSKDYLVDLAKRAMDDFAEGLKAGSHLVDVLPWRKSLFLWLSNISHLFAVRFMPSWLPGTGFKKEAADAAARLTEFVERPYNFVCDSMVSILSRLAHKATHFIFFLC
jgi:hypothetical protein